MNEALANEFDKLCGKIADGGQVELAWFLRGAVDGADGQPQDEDVGEYRMQYAAGHRVGGSL